MPKIPSEPDYFRVKVRRRLERLGAVQVKHGVYALPESDDAMEDFRWLRSEILSEGGDAIIARAQFLGGTSDAELRAPSVRPRGARWVTRIGVKVDRIASAWLIRRFIDPAAEFAFVPADGYAPRPGELRFDMFEGEFTHEGDRCTFEVLLERFSLSDAGLTHIGELVHDLDCKDDKFRRPETAGLAAAIEGLVALEPADTARLELGAATLDALYARLTRSA